MPMLNSPQFGVLFDGKQITEGLGDRRSTTASLVFWFMDEQIIDELGDWPSSNPSLVFYLMKAPIIDGLDNYTAHFYQTHLF